MRIYLLLTFQTKTRTNPFQISCGDIDGGIADGQKQEDLQKENPSWQNHCRQRLHREPDSQTLSRFASFSRTALRERSDHAVLVSLAVSLAQAIWFTGEQYDAGTFNRRLCMYRILSILRFELSKTAKGDFLASET